MRKFRLFTILMMAVVCVNLMATNTKSSTSDMCILLVAKSEVNGQDISQISKEKNHSLAIYADGDNICLSSCFRATKEQSYGQLHLSKIETNFDEGGEYFNYFLIWEYKNTYDSNKGTAVVTLILQDKYVTVIIVSEDGRFKATYQTVIVEGDIQSLLRKCQKVKHTSN